MIAKPVEVDLTNLDGDEVVNYALEYLTIHRVDKAYDKRANENIIHC